MNHFHLLAALGVVAIWGFNFVVIQIALVDVPPLLLSSLRFALVAVPAIFLIRRPAIPLHMLFGYGLVMFGLQFAFLFVAIDLGLSSGLASLVLQIHVFVTIALAAATLNERPALVQVAGALLAFSGIGIVAVNIDANVSLLGLAFALAAAVAWGVGNLIVKRIGKVDVLALVVWGCAIATVPLSALSLVLEGPDRVFQSLEGLDWVSAASIGYIVYPTTLLGFSIWAWLMNLYPAATIAPMTLLVPVFGLAFSSLVLGEPLPVWKFAALALVLAGLSINLLPIRKTLGQSGVRQ